MKSLSLLGLGYGLTKIVAAIFRSLGATYSNMLNLVDIFNNSQFSSYLNSLVDKIYTLVGIFMLFRITVSLLNYLIDPDKIDDKSIGGSKMITHIIISVILLIGLNTVVFPTLSKIQTLLLDKDGILYNLVDEANLSTNIKVDSDENLAIENFNSINKFTPSVYAISSSSGSFNENQSLCSSCTTSDSWKQFAASTLKSKVNGYFNDIGDTTKYATSMAKAMENAKNSGGLYECNSISASNCYYFEEKEYPTSNSNSVGDYRIDIIGLVTNANKKEITLNNNLSLIRTHDTSIGTSAYYLGYFDTQDEYKLSYKFKILVTKYVDSENYDYVSDYDDMGITPAGYQFSTTVLSTFVSPSNEFSSDTEYNFLKKYGENDKYSSGWWAKRIEDEQTNSDNIPYTMDWLMAIIVGIASIVLLITICITVVVRNLKLVILQAIAPIAAISYMNPKDKMLSTWIKMYSASYFELFLYLFSILLVPKLMMQLLTIDNVTGLYKIIVIAGCLLFIKEAPKFISKIFGIDSAAGSFGDAFKMVKTGLGIGAGAVAGGVVGGISGAFGAGANTSTFLGGLAGGTFRGASSGAKGKVFEGAKTQVGRNNSTKEQNLGGSTWGQRMLSKVGMDTSSRNKKDLKTLQIEDKAYENFTKHKKAIEDIADSSDFMTNLRNERNVDGSQRYTSEQLKAARTSWIQTQHDISSGIVKSGSIVIDGNTRNIVEEKGKAVGIETEMRVAEVNRKNSSIIKELNSGKEEITSFANLDTLDKEAKNARNDVTVQIAEITSQPDYLAAEASKNGKK